MNVSDEMLGAYVDGQLEASTRMEVEAAIAAQPELAARVGRLEKTRQQLRAAFDPILEERIPPHLVKTLSSRGIRARHPWPTWTAIAASVALVGLIGYLAIRAGDGSKSLLKEQDNELLADGDLADALDVQLASTQPDSAAVRVGLSFRARRSGSYCRTFAAAEHDFAGVACRESNAWHVRALTHYEHKADGAQQAGSALPPELLAIVQNEIDGEPLDAAGEAAARREALEK